MFKPSIMLADVVERPRSRTSGLRTVVVVAFGVFLLPVVAEAALLCYSQWCEVLGASAEVQTPVIESLSQNVEAARDSLAEQLGPAWHEATHDPYYVLPLAAVFIVAAMALLRW